MFMTQKTLSANRQERREDLGDGKRSLMNVRNKIGSKMLPCETPDDTRNEEEHDETTEIFCVQLGKPSELSSEQS
ncbi:unnamed protein product [Didymodactylos carnosus]|uniref:Uncharacterized protein n=1 Tax=Didymodactylos carnosus TaxID=1234261 RepID=A0A815UCN3_9BILA|nr:unnamed protein product [Didymodactylos carnosus]CAF1517686.1 unnamed protein product [Didymodactylos carnosus]CAF4019178.1 unnamed protein product [Didymodactylos carnosus]CAF4377469.1 unnamed protein product [Didymodactylos carnosus]